MSQGERRAKSGYRLCVSRREKGDVRVKERGREAEIAGGFELAAAAAARCRCRGRTSAP